MVYFTFSNSLIIHEITTCLLLFGSHGWSLIPSKRTDPNKRIRISKHVCLEINFQKNAALEQMFITFQDYNFHSLQLTLTFTVELMNILEFNWFNIPRTLLSPSKSPLLVLVVFLTLLDVQGPSSLETTWIVEFTRHYLN